MERIFDRVQIEDERWYKPWFGRERSSSLCRLSEAKVQTAKGRVRRDRAFGSKEKAGLWKWRVSFVLLKKGSSE
jgi:hypothetical protein